MTAPFHPSSNGLAETAVQTFKEGMKRMQGGKESLETKVSRFLFSYKITPRSTRGLSPAEMLMSRRPRSMYDLLLPDLKTRMEKKQWKQKGLHDKTTKPRCFNPGTKNYGYGPKWIPGTNESCTGPLSYTVLTKNGQVLKRHVGQIRRRELSRPPQLDPSTPQVGPNPPTVVPEQVLSPASVCPTTPMKNSESGPPKLESEPSLVVQEPQTPSLRCSIRERCPPDYYRP